MNIKRLLLAASVAAGSLCPALAAQTAVAIDDLASHGTGFDAPVLLRVVSPLRLVEGPAS